MSMKNIKGEKNVRNNFLNIFIYAKKFYYIKNICVEKKAKRVY